MLMLITLTFALPALAQEPQQQSPISAEALSHYYKGEKLMQGFFYDSAIIELKEAIRLQPDFFQAHLYLGSIYLGHRVDLVKAKEEITEALRLESNSGEAHLAIASIHSRNQDYEKAISECDLAIKLEPIAIGAHTLKAKIYLSKSDYSNAIKEYKATLKIVPNSSPFRAMLITVYILSKDFQAASKEIECLYSDRYKSYIIPIFEDRAFFKKYQDKTVERLKEMCLALPMDPNPHIVLGGIFDFEKDIKNARIEYIKAISLKPDYYVPYLKLAYTYSIQTEKKEIEKTYKDLLHVLPGCLKAYEELGDFYIQTKEYTKAIKIYKLAMRIYPSASYKYGVGLAYEELGFKKQAEKIYRAILDDNSYSLSGQMRLVSLYEKNKQYLKAIDVLKPLLVFDPFNASTELMIADLYLSANKTDKANEIFNKYIGLYKTTIQAVPDDIYAHEQLGSIYYSKKEYDSAIIEYETISKLYPNITYYLDTIKEIKAAKAKAEKEKAGKSNKGRSKK